MLDREYYDEFAVLYNETYKKDIAAGKAKALPILNSHVLPENAEGDPFAYWPNTATTADYISKFESLSKQNMSLASVQAVSQTTGRPRPNMPKELR